MCRLELRKKCVAMRRDANNSNTMRKVRVSKKHHSYSTFKVFFEKLPFEYDIKTCRMHNKYVE
jgi:hypothetical protein